MKRLLLIIAALLLATPVYAQQVTRICFTTNGTNCIPVDASNPFPVNAMATVTFPTIGAAVPATGIYNALNVAGTLRGMTGLGLGSTFSQTVAIVDASGNQITTFGSTNAEGPVTAGTVATKSILLGCQYLSSAQTFTNAQQGAVLCSANGHAIVDVGNVNSNGQATAANSSPVVLASNQTAADPCMFQAKTNLPISQNGTSSVQLIALSGSTSIYVCSLSLIAAGATTVALTTGTGSACVTGNAAVLGSTTSNIANSLSFAANGGLTLGNGQGTIAKGAASSELCMINGSNVFVSGNLTYVQQ